MALEENGKVSSPSWAIIGIRASFLREAAEIMTRRAAQLNDLGADVKPLKGYSAVSRMDLRSKADPSAVWSHLDNLETTLKEYDSHLDRCEERLAEESVPWRPPMPEGPSVKFR